VVLFDKLTTHDIAAVWRTRRVGLGAGGTIRGCSGSVVASGTGPNIWAWRYDNNAFEKNWHPAEGASFIRLPTILPPSGEVSAWLAAEVVLGLVWGGGNWFASSSASAYLGRSFDLQKRREPWRVTSAEKGRVYAMPPPGVAFPTFLSINGSNYTAETARSPVYRDDETGVVLNLTSIIFIEGVQLNALDRLLKAFPVCLNGDRSLADAVLVTWGVWRL